MRSAASDHSRRRSGGPGPPNCPTFYGVIIGLGLIWFEEVTKDSIVRWDPPIKNPGYACDSIMMYYIIGGICWIPVAQLLVNRIGCSFM